MRYYEIHVANPRPEETDDICKRRSYRMFMAKYTTYAFDARWKAIEAEKKLIAAGAKFYKYGKPFVPKIPEEAEDVGKGRA